MSHLRCPSCGLRVRAIGAPLHCPLCAAHGRGHPELVPEPMFAPVPSRPMRSVRTPPPPVFRLHERELGRGLTEVAVEGELDLATTDRLQAALERAERRGGQILLDLTDCDFIDASGLELLLTACRRLREQGARLLLSGVAPRGQVKRVLSATGLAEDGLALEDRRPAQLPKRSPDSGPRPAAGAIDAGST